MKFPVKYLLCCLKRYIFNYKSFAVFSTIFVITLVIKVLFESQTIKEDSLTILTRSKSTTLRTPVYLNPERLKQIMINKSSNNQLAEKNRTATKSKWWQERMDKISKKTPRQTVRHVEVSRTVKINYNVHIFYYAWYENVKVDGAWQHWDHEYLKNWNKQDFRIYPEGKHKPPDDIGSNFYPKLGCYSSRDPSLIDQHMKMISDIGVGVLIVSWYPPGMSDGSGLSSDTVFSQLLDFADKYHLKVTPHIEPYTNRNPYNFVQHIKYFTRTYGSHPALYRMKKNQKNLIVYYVYDSYRTPSVEWRAILGNDGNMTIRGSPFDGIFLGLVVSQTHRLDIRKGRFDGFYTYFASNGFSFGSSWKNWSKLSKFACDHGLIFIPSVGPGYIDTRVRPWNVANTRHRWNGKYYDVGWRTIFNVEVDLVSITSFNEWHEGTQIEPAVPKSIEQFTYLDYEPEGPDFYLNLTKFWVNKFTEKSQHNLIF